MFMLFIVLIQCDGQTLARILNVNNTISLSSSLGADHTIQEQLQESHCPLSEVSINGNGE